MGIINKIYAILYNHVGNMGRGKLLFKVKGVKTGNNCEIYKNVVFGSEPYLITLGDDVRITDGVKFCTHDGGVWVLRHLPYGDKISDVDRFGPIFVGNNVHIGWNSIIMPGVSIGDNVVIGAGSIVTHDIPNNSIAMGIPARVSGTVEDYYNKHKKEFDYTKNMKWNDKKLYLKQKYINNNI